MKNRPQRSRLAACLRTFRRSGLALSAVPLVGMAQTTVVAESRLPPVEVIGTSPLPGQGIARDLLPYTTHVLRRDSIDQVNPDTLADFMGRRLPGVQLNEVQGSPFQADLTYRGFRASGLLGSSQGMSVYLDGVRVNEPFGDVVNWDMIPEFSVNTLTLVPGANPAFGLNTLGGSLAFTTHTGLTAPGWRARVQAGSFGRRQLDLSHGARFGEGWHSYVAASAFDEDGWRDHSAGRLGHLLARFGHDEGDSGWNIGVQLGRSRLVGNGLVPSATLEESDGAVMRQPDLYAARPETVYTHPDRTLNRLAQLQLDWRQRTGAGHELSALAYLRHSRRDTVNGDAADDPEEALDASFNTTATRQKGHGAAVSLSGTTGPHQWQLGGTLDGSRIRFQESEQAAAFTADRGVQPGEAAPRPGARVAGRSLAVGFYGSDTWRLAAVTHLTATLRYNHARVRNQLTSVDDDTGEATVRPEESFRYDSVNPAIGLTHRLGSGLTVFANLARNNRVPTVIELGCADPEEPCRLPAGLQSDPYLEQVVSRSAELGLRWRSRHQTQVSVSAFRTDNRDDILFRSVSLGGQQGYFENFPRTRHQGLDAELETTTGALTLAASYSLLQATYQAEGVLRQGERNVEVGRGTRIAGLPRHTLKLSADWRFASGWSAGADMQAVSSRGVAGNEDGRIEDGGTALAPLRLPGHAVVNLRAAWRPAGTGWELFAKVNNLFDRRSESFGALGETVFDAQGRYTGDERTALFVAPGAPRSVFAGARWRY